MHLEYANKHIIIRVLDERWAQQVLDFYYSNRDNFEPFEIEKPDNFYTLVFQKRLLHAEYEAFVHSQQMRFFLFDQLDPDTIIGTVSFFNIKRQNFQACELGYKIDKHFTGRGYATEMLRLAMKAMIEDFGMHRFCAYIQPSNLASIRLVRKLQFQLEGTARGLVWLHDSWQDHLCYSYLASPIF